MQPLMELLAALDEAYPTSGDRRYAVDLIGVPAGSINLEGTGKTVWHKVIREVEARDMMKALGAFLMVDGRPHLVPLVEALDEANRAGRGPAAAPSVSHWQGPEDEDNLEKIIGARSSLAPVSYFATGLDRARSVVRISYGDAGSGTGFVIPGNRLVTNNHVLPDADRARGAAAQFNYQKTPDGLDAPIEEMKLDPDGFFRTSKQDDWTVVAFAGEVNAKWGTIPLEAHPVKQGDFVNIIQHPGGGPKQISISANVVAYAGEGRVQYLTDTLPGSSGSPVFDRDWNLVALHHSGGWLKEPNARVKKAFFRNEGIDVARILSGLE